jgi:CHAT domain-containing protein/tetratricopeptide (TPR) repeat protein
VHRASAQLDTSAFEAMTPREHAELANLHAARAATAPDGGERDRAMAGAHIAAAVAAMAAQEGNDLISRGLIHNALAMVYGHSDQGDAAENGELALNNIQSAVGLFARAGDAALAAKARANLGGAYLRRTAGTDEANVEQAIYHLAKALGQLPQGDPAWIDAQSNLADAYQRRKLGSRDDNLAQAVACLRAALERVDPDTDPDRWTDLQNNLGNAFARHPRGDDDLHEAISHFEAALGATDRDLLPRQWADLHSNVSRALGDLREGDRDAHLADSIEHLRCALEIYTPHAFPRAHLETQRAVGHKLLQAGHVADARAAFAAAIDVERILFADAFTWDGRQAELASSAALYFRDAYCLVRLGRLDEALARLEEGRSRRLSEALSVLEARSLPEADTTKIAGAQMLVQRLEAEQRSLSSRAPTRAFLETTTKLQQAREALVEAVDTVRPRGAGEAPPALPLMIPATAVLIAPIVTEAGTVVLVIPGDTTTLGEEHVLALDTLTLHDVYELLVGDEGWLPAYTRREDEPDLWRTTIASTCRRLWDTLIGPAEARARALGLAPGGEVVLLPPGLLALLPLHAAMRPTDGRQRSLCDDAVVSYVPSLAALARSGRTARAAVDAPASGLVVRAPARDLPFAALEAELVLGRFDPASRHELAGRAATVKRTVDSAPRHRYLHFACHGRNDPARPLRSHLKLSRGPLALADVLERLDLADARLAVLSACETGLFEIDAAVDEQLGLTAGFLQSGCACVVSSLWPVDDVATMLLMLRFYELHLGPERRPPAAALCEAQRWLKAASNAQLAASFRELRETATGTRRDAANEQLARFALARDAAETPFEHPCFWAGFVAQGA